MAAVTGPAKPVVKKTWPTKLDHPTYSVEPCPECEYPEADGGFCPNCGWQRYDPTCPHCRQMMGRGTRRKT